MRKCKKKAKKQNSKRLEKARHGITAHTCNPSYMGSLGRRIVVRGQPRYTVQDPI
jgi:hypothetical protein